MEDVYDSDKATERLAGQAPWWTPGTANGYHPVTQGHLVSELIRRSTGKRAREFIAEEIAGPLDADFQLGLPKKDYHRVAGSFLLRHSCLHQVPIRLVFQHERYPRLPCKPSLQRRPSLEMLSYRRSTGSEMHEAMLGSSPRYPWVGRLMGRSF
jgi:CubicO group peptidase (beta-lactamase class C family)